MIYNIGISVYVPSKTVSIEASSEAEARERMNKMLSDTQSEVATIKKAVVRSSIYLSDINFKYNKGGVYLIRFYNKNVPAVCVRSSYYRDAWEHTFNILKTGRTVTFKVRGRTTLCNKVVKMLCSNGEPNKPECDACCERFYCLTTHHK